EMTGGAPPMVKPMTVAIDPLAVYRRMPIVGLNELDIHVTRETHGKRHVGLGILAAIFRIRAGEVIQQKPRTHAQLVDPMLHRHVNVGHQIAHLDDTIIRLTETYESHRRTSTMINPRRRAPSHRRSRSAA